jgi:hypothetical protein
LHSWIAACLADGVQAPNKDGDTSGHHITYIYSQNYPTYTLFLRL